MPIFIAEFKRTKVNTEAFIQLKLVENKDIKIGSSNNFVNRFVLYNDNLKYNKTLYFVIYNLGNHNWPSGQVPGC